MKNPIYKPKGRALEYCDLALNIYDSCGHGCRYCYARDLAARYGRPWGDTVSPRPGLVEAVEKQLAKDQIKCRVILLCFTCDPYPIGADSTATREVIKLIKDSGNFVKILTKGDETAQRDFDLLGAGDWFGVTWSGAGPKDEPDAAHPKQRYLNISVAKHQFGINTWLSCEPVLCPSAVTRTIPHFSSVDLWTFGKLNHRPNFINWGAFGRQAEELCQKYGRNYYIKEDLRKVMGREKS